MKKLILLILGAGAAGLLSYTALYHYRVAEAAPVNETLWLREEFALSDAQFAEVKRLEAAYQPICDSHCRRYAEAYANLAVLLKHNRTWTDETQQALETLYAVEMECHRGTLKHAYAVSAVMSPEQGTRYLEMVRARLKLPSVESTAQMTR